MRRCVFGSAHKSYACWICMVFGADGIVLDGDVLSTVGSKV